MEHKKSMHRFNKQDPPFCLITFPDDESYGQLFSVLLFYVFSTVEVYLGQMINDEERVFREIVVA
jgi:hypothetical protein